MDEAQTMQQLEKPNTIHTLVRDFKLAGLQPGMTLLVHSSMSKIGWVNGGPVAVVQALMEVITPDGTLIMPSHSGDLSEPSRWQLPPAPESWWQEIRDTMPAFHPVYTPTRGIGKIAEVFRTMPGVLRSNHPTVSFAAWGKHARLVTEHHQLSYSMGDQSPLARIYDLDGWVMLMGVSFGNNTSFHLSEYRAKGSKTYMEGSPIMVDGSRRWQQYEEIDWDDEQFSPLGDDFEMTSRVVHAKVGNAQIKLFHQRQAVDFGVQWLEAKRGISE